MFTVENVVRLAARMIGLEEKTDAYFNGSVSEEGTRIVQGLVNCFNLVENELAVDYLPLVCEDTLSTDDNGRIEYARLSKKVAYIISVCDKQGNVVSAKRMPAYLALDVGEYVVRYAALPAETRSTRPGNSRPAKARPTAASGFTAEMEDAMILSASRRRI